MVDAQEVMLDLVVRGSDGRQIRNLRPQDLAIYENGVRQQLRSLQLIEGGRSERQSITPGSVQNEPEPLRQLRIIVLAFDSMPVDSARRARAAADALLNLPVAPLTYYAVASIDPKLRIVQNFTRDTARIRAAVDAATAPRAFAADQGFTTPAITQEVGTLTGPAAPTDEMAKTLKNILERMRAADEEIQGARQLGALLALVSGLREQAGRKTILLFSEGLHRFNSLHLYNGLVGAANLANVSFYGLETGGLGVQSPTGLGTIGPFVASEEPRVPHSTWLDETTTRHPRQNLEALAADTGGQLLGDTNDLRTRMKDLAEDVFSYWIATYAPQRTDWDGRFREVKVEVKRRGVKVQSRSGYFALPPDMRDVLLPYEVPLLKALGQTPPPKQFDFRMAAFRFRPGGESTQVVVDFEAPLAGLSVHQDQKQKTFEAKAAFLMLVKNADGRAVRKVHREVPFNSRLDRLAEYQAGNFIFNDSFSLPPGRYTIEGAVTDRLDNRVAVKRSVLTIPAHGPGLKMGSLLVVRRVEDLPAEEKNVAVPDDDPLRIAAGKVTPALSPKIKSGPDAQLSLYISLYPDASISAAPTLRLECVREGMTALSVNLPVPALDASGRIAAVLQVPVGALPAGRYDVLVRAQQGTSAAEERVTVELE